MDSAALGQSHCVLVALEEAVGGIGAPVRYALLGAPLLLPNCMSKRASCAILTPL